MKKIAVLLLICMIFTLVACTPAENPPQVTSTENITSESSAEQSENTEVTEPASDTEVTEPVSDTEVTEPVSDTEVTEAETDAPITPHTEHIYTETTVEPTLTEQGYVLHTCECGDSYMDQFTGMKHEKETEKPVYNILFIGNSYTNRSSLWNLVQNIANDRGYTLNVDHVIKGGWTLLQMADPADECGSQVDSKLKNKKYDYVFIQEQSERPATAPGMFYDGVRALNEKIRASGAVPILFQTWGRKAGSQTLTQNGWSDERMTKLLAGAYEAIGRECDIDVSPVGTAFYDVIKNHPEIELYDPDLSHPSYAGSYLAALCHYAMIYGKSPIGVTYLYGVENKNEAKILQEAAHKAVFGERLLKEDEIPDSTDVSGTSLVLLDKIPEGSKLISVNILGDKGEVSAGATAASGAQLSSKQLKMLADTSYGISIIGTKDMVKPLSTLIDGQWKGTRLSYHFADGNKHYGIDGVEDDSEKYRALITLNFGKVVTIDAAGYCSGSLGGFAQSQDTFISNDGVTWAKIESASYTTTSGMTSVPNVADKNGNVSNVCVIFDMQGVQAKYIRLGITVGVTANDWDMNTFEFVVFGNDGN